MHEHLIEQFLVLAILGLVLVESQLLHPLLRPLRLLRRQLLLPFLLLLLGCLNCLELLEHILVVQDCVGELVTEVLFVEEFLDALGNHGVPKNSINIGPLLRVNIQHTLQQVGNILAKVARHVIVLPLDDFVSQLVQRLSIEGWLQSAHLVEQDAEGPDVGLEAVGLGLNDLG